MISKSDKNQNRKVRHLRVRNKVKGTAQAPRLNVYRSLNKIYAQIIDDTTGNTLVSASSLEKEIAAKCKGLNKTEQARIVGKAIGERALAKKIDTVVFDRGGYLYIGRVQALAEGAREAGLKF